METLECIVMLGKARFKPLKLTFGDSGEIFVILPIPDLGLHASIHPPKPPLYPNWHGHVRGRPELGIHEDFDADLSQVQRSPESLAQGFLDTIRIAPPTGEEVLVMPPRLVSSFVEHQVGSKKRTIADLGLLINAMATGTFYQTTLKHLPLLSQTFRSQRPSLDKGVNVFGISNDKIVMLIDSKNMLEFDYPQLMENSGYIHLLDGLFDSMQRAVERLEAVRPSCLQGWFPQNFAKEIEISIGSMKSRRSQFVDFP